MPITTLMPVPKQQYFSNAGEPLVGGMLYAYKAGTNILQDTFTDAAGTIPQPNPIPLNARGEPNSAIYWAGVYDVELYDSLGNLIYTVDNFNTDPSGAWTILTQFATAAGSTLVGFLQAGVGAVLQAIREKLRSLEINAFDFMTPAQIADVKAGTYLVDVTASLNAAATAAAGRKLVLSPGGYKCASTITFQGPVEGYGATLKFTAGVPVANLVSIAVEGNQMGYTIDGAGVASCQNGLFVNTDFTQKDTSFYRLQINNISNSNNTQGCNGALFFKSNAAAINLKSKFDIQIDVDGVTATANGVIGDTGGSSTGIFVSFNGIGTDSSILIHDSIVQNILPAEDSGGIQLFVGDHTVAGSLGNYTVRNCKVINSKKRGVKVQAQNANISKVTVYGQTTEVGFDSYAVNTLFEDCKYLFGSSTGFRSQGVDTVFARCRAETSTQQPTLRLEAGAINPLVRDSGFVNTAAFAGVANNIVLINGVANSIFENVSVAGTTNTGSAFSIAGTCDVRFRGGAIQGTEYGVYLAFSQGTFGFSEGAAMSVLNFGFFRTGATPQLIVCNDATINAVIGFNLVSGGAGATVDLNNCRIGTSSSGVLASAGSRIVDCQLTNLGVVGTAISAGNSVSRGNRISGYAVGVSYTFTTTAEVANNVTIGTTLPYETTGFVAFVNNDNFSR